MMTGRGLMGGGVGLAAALSGAVAFSMAPATTAGGALDDRTPVAAADVQETRDLERKIEAAPDGSVRFHFAAREGVCGDGGSLHVTIHGEDEPDHGCHHGPVWVEVEKRGGRPVDLDMWAGQTRGSRADARTDLGPVGVAEAADYLVSLAGRADEDVAGDAIGAAALADSVVIWPELLEIARDDGLDSGTREAAIFWLSQHAGDRATESLESIARGDGDSDVRQAALFGLSQLPNGAGVDVLLSVARESDDPELVEASLFWLGQTGDPKAIALFEEILTRN